MYKCERQDEILSALNETGYATVEYLSEIMNISPSSIRRDLKNMEGRGLVIRSYGGVKLSDSTGKRIPFSLRSHENSGQKKKIAAKAVSLVQPGNVVILDGSSSACFLAEPLSAIGGVTVITNSIDSMQILKEFNVKAICIGGILSSENRSVAVGSFASNFISGIHADIVFFSVQGVADDGRCFDCYGDEVPVREAMFRSADKRVLLCDRSKFGKTSTYFQCNLSDLDAVVCDMPPEGSLFENHRDKFIISD